MTISREARRTYKRKRRSTPAGDRDRAYARGYYKGSDKDKIRDRSHRYYYGITLAEKVAILAAQANVCACCGATDPGSNNWHTDHDHETGLVRGVLCRACNLILGYLGDSVEAVSSSAEKLLQYLTVGAPLTQQRLKQFRETNQQQESE